MVAFFTFFFLKFGLRPVIFEFRPPTSDFQPHSMYPVPLLYRAEKTDPLPEKILHLLRMCSATSLLFVTSRLLKRSTKIDSSSIPARIGQISSADASGSNPKSPFGAGPLKCVFASSRTHSKFLLSGNFLKQGNRSPFRQFGNQYQWKGLFCSLPFGCQPL
jgi:hypothetical protein